MIIDYTGYYKIPSLVQQVQSSYPHSLQSSPQCLVISTSIPAIVLNNFAILGNVFISNSPNQPINHPAMIQSVPPIPS